ncbi:MAG: ADP-ribosylglycohydrolase family protein [Gemmatimonadetes bacterium]|nr:ADP-ribosylglycohydrolase family protein [Gemmatimonadota bacterium]
MPTLPIPNSYRLPGFALAAGEYPGDKPEPGNLAARTKLARFLDAGVTGFIDLTSLHDPLEPYDALLAALARERGLDVSYDRLTIPDMDVCAPDHMARILATMESRLAEGRYVYVHCWGGVGRTGTVIGCWLARHGASGDEALATVKSLFASMPAAKLRRHPGGSPETHAQREIVRGWPEVERARPRHRVAAAPLRRVDQARGCLLGGAVGDALGAPVEFMSWTQIAQRFGPSGIQDFAPAYGRLGAITDDTQMTLWTAEGVLRGIVRANERGVGGPMSVLPRSYLRWLYTQDGSLPAGTQGVEDVIGSDTVSAGWLFGVKELHSRRAPGNTCLSALRTPRAELWERAQNDSKGCGGVMRVAPIALIEHPVPDEQFTLGCQAAAITHGHPTGILASGALVWLLLQLRDGLPLERAVRDTIRRLSREPDHDETTGALHEALSLALSRHTPSAASVESLGGGWIAEEALAIGVYAALVAQDDFARGVRLAVNHSGDSDSTGSIAGQLLGIQLGVEAIPAQWLEALELREVIEQVAEDLVTGVEGMADAWERYPGF